MTNEIKSEIDCVNEAWELIKENNYDYSCS